MLITQDQFAVVRVIGAKRFEANSTGKAQTLQFPNGIRVTVAPPKKAAK